MPLLTELVGALAGSADMLLTDGASLALIGKLFK